MTRRIAALAIAACFAVVAAPATAARHQKKNTSEFIYDQHAVGAPVYDGATARRRNTFQRRSRPVHQPANRVNSASTSRGCLHHSARDLLQRLEARFGRVDLISTCRPGARMPSGDVSWHARNQAFDFTVRKGVDKRDVMVWLGQHSPGVTMSYRNMAHIHTDTGTFHKVIYNAASHEAGERAVAIWKARAEMAQRAPLLVPVAAVAPVQMASADPSQPFNDDSFEVQPPMQRPEPIGPEDRRNIFLRYVASREVVVRSNVTFSCPGGRPMPIGLMDLLKDSAAHFKRTVYVNSAFRSKAYNDALRRRGVRAARSSQHIQCKAVDFRVAGINAGDVRRWVMANLNRWGITGLGYYGPSGHLHADVRKATRLVTWTGGQRRYAKRRHARYAAAG